MGYRSEVAYVIQFEDVQHKNEFIATTKLLEPHGKALEELNHLDDDCTYLSFHWDNVKWYDSYPEVQMHIKLLDYINELSEDEAYTKDISARFARVGEDETDNVNEGYGDDPWSIELYISRHIEADYDL